jgi:hypothetical protein
MSAKNPRQYTSLPPPPPPPPVTTSKLLHIDFERGYGGMGVPTTWLYSQAESLSGSYRVVSDETLASVGHYMLKLYQAMGNPNGAEGRVRVDGLLPGVQYMSTATPCAAGLPCSTSPIGRAA